MIMDQGQARAVAAIARQAMRAKVSADLPALIWSIRSSKNGRDVDDVAAVSSWRHGQRQVLSIRAEMAKETMPAVMQNTASR